MSDRLQNQNYLQPMMKKKQADNTTRVPVQCSSSTLFGGDSTTLDVGKYKLGNGNKF